MRLLLIAALFVCISACSSSPVEERSFISTDKGDVWTCFIPTYDKAVIDEFGKTWANPRNEVVMYFYTGYAPIVSEAYGYDAAIKMANKGNPVAVFSRYANGKTSVIKL